MIISGSDNEEYKIELIKNEVNINCIPEEKTFKFFTIEGKFICFYLISTNTTFPLKSPFSLSGKKVGINLHHRIQEESLNSLNFLKVVY